MTHCVFHNEKTPSLSLFKADDGTWHFKCFGCGAVGDPIKYLQLKQGMSFVDAVNELAQEAKTAPPVAKAVASYDYYSSEGELLYQVLRLEPKSFRQRRRDGDRWVWDMCGVTKVLYRLPNVLTTSARDLYYVEGEKDVETLEKHGILATTHAGGAGAFREELLQPLSRTKHRIVVVPDMDEPGKQVMRKVFAACNKQKLPVAFLLLPKIGDTQPKDVTDWFNMGGTAEDLAKEIK